MLPDGQVVAIKRAQQGSVQGGFEFKTEIELLSRVHHKNLVGLIGFCFEQGEQMLVYEFMANGTLRESLSDIKSANILLDEHLTAKVADFGLSKLVSDSSKGHISTQVKGTLGYLDPEYYMTEQLSEKSDVYSFGVVMLELVTAKQPIEKGKYIVREEDSGSFWNWQCPTMSEVVKAIETILHNDGMKSNSTSASSSATDFGVSKARHPYYVDDPFPKSDAFDYSGGYALPAKVEPK
ncbi:hypothetical protein ACFE04_021026 [Oxalis oulophora]